MRVFTAFLILASAPAHAQPAPPPSAIAPASQPLVPAVWNPAASYITAGQDEPGYRAWYNGSPLRPIQVRAFNAYLTQYGVGGVVPTWQLLRTATSWQRCGGQPFEVPPMSQWPNLVQTLRYISGYVIPAIGPVEPVSAYRNPVLNECAGGAPESAHKHYSAVDLVPLSVTSRETLMRRLCAVHGRRGTAYDVGLGFYAFLRFHVDTTKYRRWGADSGHSSCPPLLRPVQVAAAPVPQDTAMPTATAVAAAATAPGAAQASAVAPTTSATEPMPIDPLAPAPAPAARPGTEPEAPPQR